MQSFSVMVHVLAPVSLWFLRWCPSAVRYVVGLSSVDGPPIVNGVCVYVDDGGQFVKTIAPEQFIQNLRWKRYHS